ncbi:MAG: F0F1 ATP synthase subunit gamma, partial [Firmicutes bacterium]|nr:F0F1 ATP synthase subunit gamma [Bacillota bacterium]
MAGMQELDRRIKSVKNTQQITRAMRLVAAAKMRKAEVRAQNAHPYWEAIHDVLARTARQHVAGMDVLNGRPVQHTAMVVVTSTRGLAGPHNVNVLREARQHMERIHELHPEIIAVGRKGRDYFKHRDFSLLAQFPELGDEPTLNDAQSIAQEVMAGFASGRVDQVFLTYTEFVNAMSYKPRTIRLLPVEPPEGPAETYTLNFEP